MKLTVHSSRSMSVFLLVCSECKSEKSSRLCGSGTLPGSDKTAFKWAIVSINTTVLNVTTFMGPQMLLIKIEILNGKIVQILQCNSFSFYLPVLHGRHDNPAGDDIVYIWEKTKDHLFCSEKSNEILKITCIKDWQIRYKHTNYTAGIFNECHVWNRNFFLSLVSCLCFFV